MSDRLGFVDALLAAPAGVALLGMLEAQVPDDVPWWQIPTDSDPHAVGAAADSVTARTFGSMLAAAVDAAMMRVGPWMPGAADELIKAYRHAGVRVRIAEAIADRFSRELHRGFDVDAQEWWTSHEPGDELRITPGFRSLDRVYGAGQHTEDVCGPSPARHPKCTSTWRPPGNSRRVP